MRKPHAFLVLLMMALLAGPAMAGTVTKGSVTSESRAAIVAQGALGIDAKVSLALTLFNGRLVLVRGFRGLGAHELPGGNVYQGVQDGPEGVDPLGAHGGTATSSVTPIPTFNP